MRNYEQFLLHTALGQRERVPVSRGQEIPQEGQGELALAASAGVVVFFAVVVCTDVVDCFCLW